MLTKVCILLVILTLSTALPHYCTGYCAYHTITVSGNAQISVQPDTAQISIQITASGNTTNEALNSLGQIFNSVVSILTSNGINSSSYQTINFNVYANSSYVNGVEVTYGQIANQQIQVTIFPINPNGNNVASLFDGLAQVNGIIINGLYFSLSNKTNALTTVRALAYQNLLNRADDYASAAGAVVGHPITISDEYTISPYSSSSSGGAPGLSLSETYVPTQVYIGNIQITYYLSAILGFS